MSKIRLTSPTFDASAKTVTHPSFSDVTLAGIQLITNVTDNIVIYNFADPTKGGTLAGDVLTLDYNTTSMDDTDELQILVEDGNNDLASIKSLVDSVVAPDGGTQPADGVVVMGHTGAGTVAHLRVDTNGVASVNVNNSALPTGAATSAKQDTIIGHVDGIETLITSTNTKLDTVNTNLTTIDGRVDGLEASNSAIQTSVQLIDDGVATVASAITTKGMAAVGTDGTNARILKTDTNGELQVDVLTMPTVTVDSELPAAAALADATANPTAPIVGAANLVFNGTTFDRARGDTTNGLDVDVTRVSGNVAVTMAANATTTPVKARDGAAGANDTGIPVQFVRRDTPTAVTPIAGDYEFAQISANGEQWVRLAGELADDSAFTVGTTRVVPAGLMADETATDSVDEGDIGIARMTLDRKTIVSTYAHTAGGATPYKLVSGASTNATSVKASAGTVYMITASNVNAAVRYLKLYNKASSPTVGTDTPVFTFAIPGNTAGAGTNIPIPNVGINFSTGIAFALTTEATDAGTTGVAANEIVVNLAYA